MVDGPSMSRGRHAGHRGRLRAGRAAPEAAALVPVTGAAQSGLGWMAHLVRRPCSGGDDVHDDAELAGGASKERADVGLAAEPQLAPVGKPGGEALGDEQTRAAVAGGDARRLVEQRARIEHLQDLGVGPTDGTDHVVRRSGKELGELAAAAAMQCLEEAPVAARAEGHLVVGKASRPAGAKDVDGEVLVEDDHRGRPRSALCSPEEGVGGGHLVEGGLELVFQVPVDEPSEELASGLAEARVTAASPPPALLEQFLADGHVPILALWTKRCGRTHSFPSTLPLGRMTRRVHLAQPGN